MLDSLQSIKVLSDALPFIQEFTGSTIVIKYGGAAMKNDQLKKKVIDDLLFLYFIGIKLILVHGGGPIINSWLKRVNVEPKFENGIRVTDRQTMEIVEMVLVGKVNQDLVTLLNRKYSFAIGLSGKDGNLIKASKLFDADDNFVGKVKSINTTLLNLLLDKGYIPVITSIAPDEDGQAYNINADTVAAAIAIELKADKLILLTDTSGIMYDINDKSTLVKNLSSTEINILKRDQVIFGGMIPKVDCCISALRGNVKSTHIIDGRLEHALLLEILTSEGVGSMITL